MELLKQKNYKVTLVTEYHQRERKKDNCFKILSHEKCI